MIKSRIENKGNSAKLQAIPAKSLRARYEPGDLNGAIVSAYRYAIKTNASAYVYPGNSYMVLVYRVTPNLADANCFNNNRLKGRKAIEITPSGEFFDIEFND